MYHLIFRWLCFHFLTSVILEYFPPLLSLYTFHPRYPWTFQGSGSIKRLLLNASSYSNVQRPMSLPSIPMSNVKCHFHQEILVNSNVQTCSAALFPSLQAFSISSILVKAVKWVLFQYLISIFQYLIFKIIHIGQSSQMGNPVGVIYFQLSFSRDIFLRGSEKRQTIRERGRQSWWYPKPFFNNWKLEQDDRISILIRL